MVNKKAMVNFAADSEARPVAMLVQIASQFESKVYILDKSKKINAKSIMGMMSVNFARGDELEVSAEGADEDSAVEAIIKYIETGSLA